MLALTTDAPSPRTRTRRPPHRHLRSRRFGHYRETGFQRRRRRSCATFLTTAATPKAIHDYKAAIHALDPLGIPLQGVQHDPMLYSYLLDPTYSSHRLADVALRRFNLKLSRPASI